MRRTTIAFLLSRRAGSAEWTRAWALFVCSTRFGSMRSSFQSGAKRRALCALRSLTVMLSN